MKPLTPAARARARGARSRRRAADSGSSSARAAARERSARAASDSRIQASVTPCASARAARALDGDAVGHRIAERHADLDDVRGAARRARAVAAKLARSGITRREERDQRGRRAARRAPYRPRDRVSPGGSWRRASRAPSVARSLSPRPERPMSMRCPGMRARPSAARRRTHARSRAPAGCPSRWQHSRARGERLVVARHPVLDAPDRLQQRVLGADARIVEARGDRVRLLHLAVRVLQQQRIAAVQHAGTPVGERRGVLAEPVAAAAGLDAEQRARRASRDEGMEQADRVRAAADAGDRDVRQAPACIQHLRARLAADDGLQLAHQIGIGMRPDGRAEQVVACRPDRRPSRAAPRRSRRAACGRRSSTGTTSAPSRRMRSTFGACRSMSTAPM